MQSLAKALFTCCLLFSSIVSISGQNLRLFDEYTDDLKRKYGLKDMFGEVVVEPIYDEIGNFREGLARVRQGEFYGYLNEKGELVVPVKYQGAFGITNGISSVKRDGLWGFINTEGIEYIPAKYSSVKSESNGYISVKSDTAWGVISIKGDTVVSFLLEDAGKYAEGVIPAKAGGKWGFIDLQGNWVLAPYYDYTREFADGLAAVQYGDKWGYIDHNNEVWVSFAYTDAYSFKDGEASVYVKTVNSKIKKPSGPLPKNVPSNYYSPTMATPQMQEELIRYLNNGVAISISGMEERGVPYVMQKDLVCPSTMDWNFSLFHAEEGYLYAVMLIVSEEVEDAWVYTKMMNKTGIYTSTEVRRKSDFKTGTYSEFYCEKTGEHYFYYQIRAKKYYNFPMKMLVFRKRP